MSDYPRVKFKTPPMRILFPHVNEPCRKWDKNGVWQLNGILCESNPEHVEFKNFIETEFKKFCAYEETGKRMKKTKGFSMRPNMDKDKNEIPGEMRLEFKNDAYSTDRQTGEITPRRIILVDANKQPMTERVGTGSNVIVVGEMNFWNTANMGCGCTMWLKVVQVLDLIDPKNRDEQLLDDLEVQDGFKTTEEAVDSDVAMLDSESISVTSSDGDF